MIPKEFTLTKRLFDKFEEFVSSIEPNEYYALEERLINPETKSLWKTDLEKAFEEDYNYFVKEGKYFVGCNFEVFKETFEERKEKYLKEKKDALEMDFVLKEYNKISFLEVFGFAGEELKERIEVSLRRQKEFLEQIANSLDCKLYKVKNNLGEYIYDYKFSITEEVELLDLSDSKLTERIICLYELGVVDFLIGKLKYGYSTNRIAELLSNILSENPSTVQSYINPIGNQNVSQKNNPYKNNKAVQKVRNMLADLGFETTVKDLNK